MVVHWFKVHDYYHSSILADTILLILKEENIAKKQFSRCWKTPFLFRWHIRIMIEMECHKEYD